MNTITSSAQLLARPPHERQVLIVVPDPAAQELAPGSATNHPGQSTHEAELPPEHQAAIQVLASLGVSEGPRVAGTVVGRARGLILAGAARAPAVPPALVPVLAIGAVGFGAAAFFIKGRDGAPTNVVLVSASAAQDLTFSEGPFTLGRTYAAHPLAQSRYLPLEDVARIVLEERTRETETFLLACCGASKVETTVEFGDDLDLAAGYKGPPAAAGSGDVTAKHATSSTRTAVIEGPGHPAPNPLVRSEWTWHDEEWDQIHRQRAEASIESYELTREIKDDRTVDFKALAKVAGVKLNMNADIGRHDKAVVTWKATFPAAQS